MSDSRPSCLAPPCTYWSILLFGTVLVGCGPQLVADELVGTYTYTAQGALTCTEAPVTNIPPYQCTCQEPGRYEGTLILRESSGTLAGELQFRMCNASDACGSQQKVPVAPSGQDLNRQRVVFYLTNDSFTGGSGSWSHTAQGWSRSLIQGTHRRRDGSLRGCGDDSGIFSAVRR